MSYGGVNIEIQRTRKSSAKKRYVSLNFQTEPRLKWRKNWASAPPQQIANWKRQFNRLSDKQFNTLAGVDYSKKESEELRALRRENKRLRDEMEFLKKVSAYFAKQQE